MTTPSDPLSTTLTATTTTDDPPPLNAYLIPLDLENPGERAILHAQRQICGWGADKIPAWRAQALRGDRSFFWVTIPSASASATTTATSPHAPTDPNVPTNDPERARRRAREVTLLSSALAPLPARAAQPDAPLLVGHIALDRVDVFDPPDARLTTPDGRLLTLTSLFILPAFASQGLGRYAVRCVERLAAERGATAVSLSTLCEKYHDGGSEDMRALWRRIGRAQPGRGNVGWYVDVGYVVVAQDVPRYWNAWEQGGSEGKWWDATFLVKQLR